MPRYVILEHDHPVLHWDLMLETGATLRTWRLALPPAPAVEIGALALGDHRRAYLDYEGPVGGGRGSVRRWDHGSYSITSALEAELLVELHGEHLAGRARLTRVQGEEWLFVLEP
jgi:hypothetical protein